MFELNRQYRCKRSGAVGTCIIILGGSSEGKALITDPVATKEERLRVAKLSPHLDQEKVNISMVRDFDQVEPI